MQQQNVDVFFERFGRRFFMIFPELSEKTISLKDYLFGKNIKIVFKNEEPQQFIAFDCLRLKSRRLRFYFK